MLVCSGRFLRRPSRSERLNWPSWMESDESTWSEVAGSLPTPDYHGTPAFRAKYHGARIVAWEASVKAEGLLDGLAHHGVFSTAMKIGGWLSRL